MRRLLACALAIATASCGPVYPPPPGFVEACYGGDFAKHHDGNIPVLTVRISAPESQWPQLAAHVRRFALAQGLMFFDTTLMLDHVHALDLSVCSDLGVQISIAEQHWRTGPFAGKVVGKSNPDHVDVFFYRYKAYPYESLADSLLADMKRWDPEASRY